MKQLVDLKVRNNMLKQELEVSQRGERLLTALFCGLEVMWRVDCAQQGALPEFYLSSNGNGWQHSTGLLALRAACKPNALVPTRVVAAA